MTDVRVGIVSWNTADLLRRCLDALPAALAPLDAEVVVVDNASQDGSADMAAECDWVRVLRNDDNRGYAAAMNQALAGDPVRALIALNPDTLPAPGSLAHLVRRLDDEPSLGLVAPRLVNANGSVQHSVYRFPSLATAAAVCLVPAAGHRRFLGRRFWLEGGAPHDRRETVDWPIGAVHCIRTAALDGKPPYSERSFIYTEDMDLCWRLWRTGWQVEYDPSVAVTHVGNASGEQAFGPDRTLRWLHETYGWMARERGALRTWLWAAINAVGVALDMLTGLPRALPSTPAAKQRRYVIRQLSRQLQVHLHHVARPARRPPGAVPS